MISLHGTLSGLTGRKKAVIGDTAAFAVFAFTAVLLCYKATHNLGTPDESFYITIPHRLVLGDALLIDEWHASQFSSFLQYLPVLLYTKLTGSTEGIILFSRCLYLVCQMTVGAFIYRALRKNSILAGIVSMLLFCLYIPELVMALDYYTENILAAEIICLLLFTSNKRGKLRCFFVGVLTAFAVLAQPFNSLVYFAYCIVFLVFLLRRKRSGADISAESLFSVRVWLWMTAGIFTVAAVFSVFLFSMAPAEEILRSLPNIFSGSDHVLPFSERRSDMFTYDVLVKSLFKSAPVLFPASCGILLAMLVDRKKQIHRRGWAVLCSVAFVAYYAEMFIRIADNYTGVLFRPFPLFIFALECFILTQKKSRKLFSFWSVSLLFAASLGLVSQALDYVGAICFAVAYPADILMIKQFADELKQPETQQVKASSMSSSPREQTKQLSEAKSAGKLKNRLTASVCVILTAALLLGTAADIGVGLVSPFIERRAMQSVFGESGDSSIKLSDGPMKGIKIPADKALQYESIRRDLDIIKRDSDGPVLIAGLIPWCYLYLDKPYATFTSWYITSEWNMYNGYYKETGNTPSYIYIPDTLFYWAGSNPETTNETLAFFSGMFKYEKYRGESGYILRVLE